MDNSATATASEAAARGVSVSFAARPNIGLPRHAHAAGQRSCLNLIKRPGTGPGSDRAADDLQAIILANRAFYKDTPVAVANSRQVIRANEIRDQRRWQMRPTRPMGQRPPAQTFAVRYEKPGQRFHDAAVVRLKGPAAKARRQYLATFMTARTAA